MRMPRFSIAVLVTMVLVALSSALGQNWKVTRAMHVGGDGGWDYVTVDAQNHRLYVTRTTHTLVIDSESGKVVANIPGQQRSHGVAIVPKVGRGFISDGGGSGGIVIFSLKTNAVLGRIAAQPDADGIIYDAASGLVLCVSGDGGVLMTFKPDLDPKTGKMDDPIDLGGKPEFLAADGKGKAYVNLENKDEVAVVDLKTRKVLAHWPTAPGGVPVGMAMDTAKRLLFIGCRKPQKMVVMSADTGKVLADFPIGAGVDATVFDHGYAFGSSGDGTLTVIKEAPGGKFAMAGVIQTAKGARTMGMNPITKTIYLPTADLEPAQPGTRPAAKPDTFKILVVAAN